MLAILDRSTPAGCRDAAVLLLTLCVAGRISEVSALDIADIEFVDGKGMRVTLYRGKVRKMQEVPVLYAHDPDLCAVQAVQAWMAMLASVCKHTSGALFLRIDQHGNIGGRPTRNGKPIGDPDGRMTAEAIGEVFDRRGSQAGVPGRWKGHSGRRGYVTIAYEAGADRVQISRGGGWDDNSRSVAGYIGESDEWNKNPLRDAL